MGKSESMFDDPAFFLAGPIGRTDAHLEMMASIHRFLGSDLIEINNERRHPQCVFAARFAYLREHLQIDSSRISVQECPDLKKYIEFATYTGVSLVFSNYYADNPASMFGHTLIRLHRSEKQNEVGLLDDAANFSAMILKMNPFTYPFEGLFGFFKGRFALIPYSQKIQEYNNFESRDLWEYNLSFTPQEANRLALALWEVGYFQMSYYYLNKNCSFAILALFESVKPELDLTSGFHVYTIPSDTIKAIAAQPNLIRSIQFKPSAQTRYLERAWALDASEEKIFLSMIKEFEKSFSKEKFKSILMENRCDLACQIRVFDALIEFIDYKEKKISNKKIESYSDLRRELLISRSRIPQTSPALTARPEKNRPDLGPPSGMVELYEGQTSENFELSEFRWRPAHHDLSSSALGYSDQLQIQALDTSIAHATDNHKFYLKHFSPLELTSLGKHELGLSPYSWRFELSYNTDRKKDDLQSLTNRTELEVGVGDARFSGPFGGYALLEMLGGHSSDTDLSWHLGIGPRLGFFWTFRDSLKWSTYFQWMKSYGLSSPERHELVSRLAYAWNRTTESALDFRDQDNFTYGGLSLRLFY